MVSLVLVNNEGEPGKPHKSAPLLNGSTFFYTEEGGRERLRAYQGGNNIKVKMMYLLVGGENICLRM